ncbi:MAG: hypothetical protein WB696_15770 [Chthoniobacterales bacterium]
MTMAKPGIGPDQLASYCLVKPLKFGLPKQVNPSPYERGMLWLKDPNIFEGYLNKPEKTAEVLHNGWLQTGELARFDANGFLYLEGRPPRFPSMTRVKCAKNRSIACSG